MVGIGFGADTPVDIVVFGGLIDGLVTFVVIAEATIARTLTATVVIGNNVVPVVNRIAAGANPADW